LKADGVEKIGIIVDEVKEVVTLEESQIDRMAYDSKEEKSAFVTAVGKCDEDLISLLDLHAVLAEQVV
jgi:purine-binding chemotaxis protein CheW